jgi:hypothetical protein
MPFTFFYILCYMLLYRYRLYAIYCASAAGSRDSFEMSFKIRNSRFKRIARGVGLPV